MKRTFLFAIIASILTTGAIANQVVTSQTYVDNADARKVDIAQGVGTNNANVGKTLVVNSSGNLELGSPAAGNYIEDSITDGVTNKAPSENAVHDALADKQDVIDTDMMEFDVNNGPAGTLHYSVPTVASYDTTNGLVAGEYGILNNDIDIISSDGLSLLSDSEEVLSTEITDKMVPTVRVVANDIFYIWDALNNKQHIIPQSGYWFAGSHYQESSYLDSIVKGTGLVTRTGTEGHVGERKIIETADVANYGTGTATQQQIQEISIPTMGAVMAAISANGLPSATNNQVLQYSNNAWTSVTMDSAPTASSNKPVTSGGVYTAVNAKQNKMTCTRWLDNAEHTDANCLLWSIE